MTFKTGLRAPIYDFEIPLYAQKLISREKALRRMFAVTRPDPPATPSWPRPRRLRLQWRPRSPWTHMLRPLRRPPFPKPTVTTRPQGQIPPAQVRSAPCPPPWARERSGPHPAGASWKGRGTLITGVLSLPPTSSWTINPQCLTVTAETLTRQQAVPPTATQVWPLNGVTVFIPMVPKAFLPAYFWTEILEANWGS